MSLLVVSTAPCGSEGPYNALRLAEALSLRGEHVEILQVGDAVHTACAGQDPRGAHSSLEHMIVPLPVAGVECACCGTCCTTRGLSEADLLADVHVATIHELAAGVARCDNVVSF